MFLLLISFILCSSKVIGSNYSSHEIMEQIREGKKFSDIIDPSKLQYFTEFDANILIELLDNIHVPQRSCYNEILYKLRFDCEKASEEQQRILALHFTQCYYNITGKLDQFPTCVIDELKTSMMSQPVYSIYISMKAHWKNLCHFSKQNVFTEETSLSLIDLYQTILDSMNSILSLKKELKETSHFFNESFANMSVQINKTAKNVEEIQIMFDSFTGYFDIISKFIKYSSKTLNQMKFFSLIIIIALFFVLYIPKMLIPVTLLTVIFGCLDRFLGNHLSNWDNSFYRQILKYSYAITCFSYPALLIFKHITRIIKFVYSLMRKNNNQNKRCSKNLKNDNKDRNDPNKDKSNKKDPNKDKSNKKDPNKDKSIKNEKRKEKKNKESNNKDVDENEPERKKISK